MANRTFEQFGLTLERKVVKLFAKVKFVSGAPVLVTEQVINAATSPVTINPSQGFESLSSSGAGVVKLTLGSNNGGTPIFDPYVRLLNVTASLVDASGAVLAGIPVVAEDVAGTSGNPSLTLKTFVALSLGAPEFQFPPNGSVILVEVTLSNTTAL